MPLLPVRLASLSQQRHVCRANAAWQWLTAIMLGIGLQSIAVAADVNAPSTDMPEPERWNIHGQVTNVTQWHPSFHAPYSGTNSLTPDNSNRETTDVTLYLGLRLWKGAELYANPEIDQGFGLSNTVAWRVFPAPKPTRLATIRLIASCLASFCDR